MKKLKIKMIASNMLDRKFDEDFIKKSDETEHILPLEVGKCDFKPGLGYEIHIVEITEKQVEIIICNRILKTQNQLILKNNSEEFFPISGYDFSILLIFKIVEN